MPLIGWWKLDGNAYDSGPFKNNGVNTGVTFDSSYGVLGQGGYFNAGSTTRIDTITYNITTHHTMCWWAYGLQATPGAGTNSLMAGELNTTNNFIYLADGTRFRIHDGTARRDWTVDTDFYQRWRHCAVTFYNDGTANKVKLFLDGEDQGALDYDGTFTQNCIGDGYTLGSLNYYGYLNDFRIYDHVLSTKEIKEIAKCKVFHATFDNDTFESIDIFNNYQYSSLVGSPVLENYDFKTGTGCLDVSASTLSSVNYGNISVIKPTCTIAFWVYLDSLSVRCNPWGKAYGGEGAMTFETNGSISYYQGTSGINDVPYISGCSSSAGVITYGEWIHIAVVRDNASQHAVWYKNGEYLETATPGSWVYPTEGSLPLYIGDGYTTGMTGKLDDFRIYSSVLSADDILEIYQTRASLDINGNLGCYRLQEGGHQNQNLTDYTVWTVGTGTVGEFDDNGGASENYRIEGKDPWGRDTIIWEARPDSVSGPDGGWSQNPPVSIDNTKLYRFSVWSNRTVLGNGSFYFGCNGYGSVDGVIRVPYSTPDPDTNPYFYATSSIVPSEEWVLYVGHVYPHDTIETSAHPDSGRYTIDGYYGASGRDFKWLPETTTARHRTYLYNSTDISTRQQWCYPRFELCDGTEPTIPQLLKGNYYDPAYNGSVPNIGRNGVVSSANFSEIGPVDGLIGYWPLNGDLLDYSGNGRHCETGATVGDAERTAATSIGGVAPRDKYCYLIENDVGTPSNGDAIDMIGYSGNEEYILLEDGEDWSFSYWGYLSGSPLSYGIFGNADNYTTLGGRITFINSTTISIWTTAGSGNSTMSTGVTSGEWFHMVFTHNSSNLFTCYLNGSSVFSVTRAGDIYFNRIGRNSRNSSWTSFNGYMMDCRIYNKVLTAKEINILSKSFDVAAVNRKEMGVAPNRWDIYGQFKEGL